MFYKFEVEIPDMKGKIIEKKNNGVTYINYEYDRVYLPDRKYTIPKRTTIGKKNEEYPGSINDATQFRYMVEKAQVTKQKKQARKT